MKILIDTLHINKRTTGNKVYLTNLLDSIGKIDQKNKYIVLTADYNVRIFEEIIRKYNNFDILNLNYLTSDRPFFRIFCQQFLLPFLIRVNKIDLLFSPNNITCIFSRVKKVVTILSMHWNLFYNVSKYSNIKILYYKFMLKKTLKNVNHVIAISNFSKNGLIEMFKFPANNIDTIHLGIDHIYSDNVDLMNIISIAGISRTWFENNKFILFLSSLQKHKGTDKLIIAFSELAKKDDFKDLSLVIVGKSGNITIKELRALVQKNNISGKVIFTDFLSKKEIIFLYKNAFIFVFPSMIEGFGFPALEAMLHNLPVLAANSSCLPEILGNAALYADPFNIEDLQSKLEQIIMDETLRKDLIKRGKEKVRKYSWLDTAKKTIKVFKKVCD
ncbi:MAG: glycosyltransferase family 4 protein [Candidatus Helarchaeota archaeon]